MTLVMGSIGYAQKFNNGQVTTKIITGKVVDKTGEPLPGALVSATGGAETVATEADGTFTIEVPVWLKNLTASYAGHFETTQSVKKKKEVTFKLDFNIRKALDKRMKNQNKKAKREKLKY